VEQQQGAGGLKGGTIEKKQKGKKGKKQKDQELERKKPRWTKAKNI